MDFAEILKVAYGGSNFTVYAMLNVVALFASRLAFVSNRSAFAFVTLIGLCIGALGGYIEAQVTVGLTQSVLYNATIVAAIIGAGSSALVGVGVGKALDAAGIWPVSPEKVLSEAILDPKDLTQPGATAPNLTPQPPAKEG